MKADPGMFTVPKTTITIHKRTATKTSKWDNNHVWNSHKQARMVASTNTSFATGVGKTGII